jgi:hypothetical protein
VIGGSIRTPDQRRHVFVSSTLAELGAERAAVREAIERLQLTPVLFEIGARPHPPLSPASHRNERHDLDQVRRCSRNSQAGETNQRRLRAQNDHHDRVLDGVESAPFPTTLPGPTSTTGTLKEC